MKIPRTPPAFAKLFEQASAANHAGAIMRLARESAPGDDYPHWDKLRHLRPPPGVTSEEWWLAVKMQRVGALKPVPLLDKQGRPFQFSVPDLVQLELHQIDVGAGGSLGVPEPITSPQTRDRYLIRSLIEESITSSQLEGAVTTREVAKQMLSSGRKPRDKSERMILNNYITMQRIRELRETPLSPQLVMDIQGILGEQA